MGVSEKTNKVLLRTLTSCFHYYLFTSQYLQCILIVLYSLIPLTEYSILTNFQLELKSNYDWVSQSVSTSWCRAHCGTCDQILILSECCCLASVVRPLWREVGSVSCQSLSAVIVHCQDSFFPSILHVTHFMYIQYMQGLVSPGSVQQIMLH
jgi:hypothetical protein